VIRYTVIEGVATATEVSTIGVVYTALLGLLVCREFDWRRIYPILNETVSLSGAVMMIIGTATGIAWALTKSACLRDRAKPDDNGRYLAQWQAEVRVVMEQSAHRHTWIASITRILHNREAAGLFDSSEPLCPVATAPRQYDPDYA
jgi:hypothetical protein